MGCLHVYYMCMLLAVTKLVNFPQIPTESGKSANDIEDPEHYR